MKQKILQTMVMLLACLGAHAQVNSGSNGGDGAFNPTANNVSKSPVARLAQIPYIPPKHGYATPMKTETVEIPAAVLSSVETLDELPDRLTAQKPKLIVELRAVRKQDLAGEFKPFFFHNRKS